MLGESLYKAFGESRYLTGTLNTDYKFTGQREEAYINLLDYGSRRYDPELGRFIQPDSIVPTSTQGTQAWDRYAFVNNNPVRYTDPTGHRCVAADGEDEGCLNDDGTMGAGFTGQASASSGASSNDDKGCGGQRQRTCQGEIIPTTYTPQEKLPSTIVFHIADGNVVSQEPIYDFSSSPPTIIGYRMTSYAFGQMHVSIVDYFVPSDALTWTSSINTYVLEPLLAPGLENLASVGVSISCPVCAGVLTWAAALDSLNQAITFDGHLQTHDVYFTGPSPLEAPLWKMVVPSYYYVPRPYP